MNMPVDDTPEDEGEGAPRQSYNFAPGYHGVVYRADADASGGFQARPAQPPRPEDEATVEAAPSLEQALDRNPARPAYRLQSMQWGIIPSWTKRKPDYSTMLKTINCRDDSLASPGGLWASMKGRKRCIVLAQGFYEWLQKGPKGKVPHFVKRKDGKLLCMAGLWDCVTYEGDNTPHFTFTVITTSSNQQLKFLHDRMPVILEPGSEQLRMWLDPKRNEWSRELQALLKPFQGEVEVYPVSKDVGKVGNNSPSFIIPVASKENKNNIANFFARGGPSSAKDDVEEKEAPQEGSPETRSTVKSPADASSSAGQKREAPGSPKAGSQPKKAMTTGPTPTKAQRGKISATSNSSKSPSKMKGAAAGSQKITSFFKK